MWSSLDRNLDFTNRVVKNTNFDNSSHKLFLYVISKDFEWNLSRKLFNIWKEGLKKTYLRKNGKSRKYLFICLIRAK